MVVTAVVETKTARGMPASSAAATMPGPWPWPSDARQTSASQRAAENASSRPAGVVEVAGDRARAVAFHRAGGGGASREREDLVPLADRLTEHVSAQEAAAADDQEPHRRPPGESRSLRYCRASVSRSKYFST